MKKETFYLSLAGCVSFFLIAYGSYLYFSPAEPTVESTSENASAPAAPAAERPAAVKDASPLPGKFSTADSASPAAASPLPPTPTAYGSASVHVPAPAAIDEEDDEEGSNRYSNRRKSSQVRPYRKTDANQRSIRRRPASEDED